MKKIIACTEKKEYPILIDNFSPADIKKIIINYSASDKYFIVIDENVNRLHQKFIIMFISLLGKNTNCYILRSGERSKSFPELKKLIESMLQSGLSRSSSLIAIGGGVTGDISAFAASIFMRGIKLFHIPTTIVAAIDSSIGGKTAINFINKKNIIGTFYQPECVIINLPFLKTLPKTEIASGMGEVIKYSFLSDTRFFNYISDNYTSILALNESVLTEVIRNCLLIKTSIVHQDEFENGLRKILNIGHTFGHAIESASKFKIKHGIAVNAGLIMMLSISKSLKILNEQ
jgi:3-dehydroquinate synthase